MVYTIQDGSQQTPETSEIIQSTGQRHLTTTGEDYLQH